MNEKSKEMKNQWKYVDSYTNKIRVYIKQNNVVTIGTLYKKFVNNSQSEIEIITEQHKIRSIMNSMLSRGEITRIKEGQYKKTSEIF